MLDFHPHAAKLAAQSNQEAAMKDKIEQLEQDSFLRAHQQAP
jgi:hypothetical protein